jgi:cytoskeletal protein CcmA (bactofilin family)
MASNTDTPATGDKAESANNPYPTSPIKENGLTTDRKPRANGQAGVATSLDKVVIRGAFTLTEDGELQIGGNVEGNIKCHAMHVLESGTMSGDVNAESVVVKGTFNGNISTNHFTLASHAKVVSNDILVYDTVVIEPDSHFEGQLRRPNAAEAKDSRGNGSSRGNGRSNS